MSDFQQQALQLAAQQQSPAWLANLRSHAASEWQNITWPTRKTEHWKYTSLASLQKNPPEQWAGTLGSWKSEIDFIEVDAIRLVFVNGIFDAQNSSELPPEVVLFSQANGHQQAIIEQHLGSVVEGKQHIFATLNNAWWNEGGLVHVARNQRLGRRLDVPGDQGRVQRPRELIGQDRLAGARLALDQQGALQRHRGIDGDLQVVGGDVVGRAFEPAHEQPAPIGGDEQVAYQDAPEQAATKVR